MPHLRLRLRLNPGRHGTPLDQLGDFATQAEKFLRSFASDLGVSVAKGEWIATDFRNESTSWDTEYVHPVEPAVNEAGMRALDVLTSEDPYLGCNQGLFSYSTLSEFSRLGRGMDPDEFFLIGIYETDASEQPNWREVTYRKVAEIRKFLETPLVAYGSVQGVLHALFTGPKPPFLHLRPLDGGELVKCIYEPSKYRMIHEATVDAATVLNVYGDIYWDRGTNTIQQVIVKDIEAVQPLTADEFEALFGSMPDATRGMSTDQYIAWIRGDDDDE
jgi:hypothetical protein